MDFSCCHEMVLNEIRQTVSRIPNEEIEHVIDLILQANKIFLAGTGRSALIMRAFAMRLMHLGLDASVIGEVGTPAANAGDLLLIGSGSGATESVTAQAKKAKQKGLTIAAFTIVPDSPIGALSDRIVRICAPSPKARTVGDEIASAQPMGSLFEQSLMVSLDCIVLLLMEKLHKDAIDMFQRHANLE